MINLSVKPEEVVVAVVVVVVKAPVTALKTMNNHYELLCH